MKTRTIERIRQLAALLGACAIMGGVAVMAGGDPRPYPMDTPEWTR